jgi:prepilin-type N-terminal cleavage/methylation domain-containing protein/prepilin-type processing-associated H-X9-DG protein
MKTALEPSAEPVGETCGGAAAAQAGFTLIELLVVIVILAMLAALLLPALARGNQQADGDQCLAGLQQLTQAWLMYNADNRGKFPPNGGEQSQGSGPTSPDLRPGQPDAQWCPGRQDPAPGPGTAWLSPAGLPANTTNVGWQWIQAGLIYPYVNNSQVYLCPADTSYNLAVGERYPHVRSRSMNGWISPFGSPNYGGADDAKSRVYSRETDLSVPGPANTFLLLDESPVTINDSLFVADPSAPALGLPTWVDAPANFHDGACGISFCDGHVGLKHWRDTLITSLTYSQSADTWTGTARSKYEPDVLWLVNRSTALVTTASFLGPTGW